MGTINVSVFSFCSSLLGAGEGRGPLLAVKPHPPNMVSSEGKPADLLPSLASTFLPSFICTKFHKIHSTAPHTHGLHTDRYLATKHN